MKRFVSIVVCLALLGLCAGVVYTVAGHISSKSPNLGTDGGGTVTNVQVQVLAPVTVEDVIPLTGRIEPWERIAISSESVGNIEWQGIEEGDRITAGQELFRVDTTAIKTSYDQVIARRNLAVQELDRIQNLRRDGIESPQALDRVMANRDVAEADVLAVKIRLDKSIVRAPINGTAERVYRKQNEFVDMGARLVDIIQVDRVKATVGIPERDLPGFSVGDAVAVNLDAYPGQAFEGTIYRIAASADMTTRTFSAEIAIDNAKGLLKPGMTVRAKMLRGVFPDSIAVPIFSVLSVQNHRFVVVEEDGVARIRPIEVGVLQGDIVQATQGLRAGDRLIVVGHRDLRDGDRVQVTAETSE